MLPKMLQNAGCALVLAATTLTLQGCAEQRDWAAGHGTAVGAGTGALLGAGAGALLDSNNRGRGALIGAAIGGAAGAGVGYMVKKNKEAFDRIEYLESRPTTVVMQGPPPAPGHPAPAPVEREALRLTVPSEVLFSKDSSTLSPMGAAKVREIAQVLTQYPDSDIQVLGYTSSEGQDAYNMDLSERRARTVMGELVRNGVSMSRIQALGMGESAPVADNSTESGRQQNRRVELVVVPREERR